MLVPQVGDLYNLIYPSNPRHKPENTAFFLLVFPLLIGAAALIGYLRREAALDDPQLPLVVQILIAGGWLIVFFLGSLYRSTLTLLHCHLI